MVSCVALYLTGTPRIECDGDPVMPDGRKALAQVAYLAVTGKSQPQVFLLSPGRAFAPGAKR